MHTISMVLDASMQTHTNTEYLTLYTVCLPPPPFFFLNTGKYLSELSLPKQGWEGSN